MVSDPDLFQQRIVKEGVHELGHVFGLTHCEQDTVSWLIDKNTHELAMGPCYSSFPIKQSEVSRSVDVTSILETKEPILTNYIAGDLGVSNRGWIPRERVISYGGYPLMYGDRALGVLEIYSDEILSADDFELVEKLSDEISRKLGDIDPVYSRGQE